MKKVELSDKKGTGFDLTKGSIESKADQKVVSFPSEGHAMVYSLAKRLRERARAVNASRARAEQAAAAKPAETSRQGAWTAERIAEAKPGAPCAKDKPEIPFPVRPATGFQVKSASNGMVQNPEGVKSASGDALKEGAAAPKASQTSPVQTEKSVSDATPVAAVTTGEPHGQEDAAAANAIPELRVQPASHVVAQTAVKDEPVAKGDIGANADCAVKAEAAPEPFVGVAPSARSNRLIDWPKASFVRPAVVNAPEIRPEARSSTPADKAPVVTVAADTGKTESAKADNTPRVEKPQAAPAPASAPAPQANAAKAAAPQPAAPQASAAKAAAPHAAAPQAAAPQKAVTESAKASVDGKSNVAVGPQAHAAGQPQGRPNTEPNTEPKAQPAAQPKADPQAQPQAKGDPASVRAKAPATSMRDTSSSSTVPAKTASGDGGKGGDGAGSSGGGSGGGGGGRSSEPKMQKRFYDDNFRNVLKGGLSAVRRNLITIGIFSFFVNLIVLAIPVYLFNISDRVLTSRSVDTLVMLTIIVVGALLVHVLLDMLRRMILMRIAVDAETRLGPSVLSAAAKASQNGSNREYQVLHDLQQLRNFITGPVLLTFFDMPVMPIYLIVVYLIHPNLGFIVTMAGSLLLVIALINQKVTAVPFGRASAYATRANLQADAMSRNAQVINAMGMIPEGVQMWGRETVESLKAQVSAQDLNVMLSGVSKFTRMTTQIAILGWGAWLALHSEITGGMLIAASIIGSRALSPIEGAIEGWRGFVHARSAYARISTLLLNSPLNLERLRLPRPRGLVTVERVLYVPPPTKKVILNGISFELQPGESMAIVGTSGAGKSTLARMLVGSIVPTAGNIRLDHMDLRNWDPRQFGESVGYLPQDVQLFPATIKANIARMREDADDDAIYDAAETADVHEMISEFSAGYETMIGLDGAPLSGGQKQRIGLARAFFGDPRMVVLDEPNSNLDTPGEIALARALQRAKAKEITIIAITQRPTLLKSVDKIMLLKNGTVQAFGKRDDMLQMLRKDLPKGKGDQAKSLPGNGKSLPGNGNPPVNR